MKKILFSLSICLLLAAPGFAQIFKPVKIDSLVTVSLPKTYQQKDTLNQKIFSGKGLYGYMVVIKVTNAKNNAPLKKEKDLDKVFKDYMKGVQLQSGNGTILNIGDTTVGTLKAKVFTLQTNNNSGSLQLRKFILLYTTDATYTFEYLYQSISSYLIDNEIHTFTSSIKLSPELQSNDQYLIKSKPAGAHRSLFIFGGAAGIIIILIAVIVRRRKAKKQGKKKK